MTAADPAQTEEAPAKVNLTLHLRGRRPDGYHLLDSLVVFPRVGDRLTARAAQALSLDISGLFGSALAAEDDNLVLRAARALASHHGIKPNVVLELEKNLPVAAGIGGGSSDAAAALRLLSRLWEVPVPAGLAAGLGADVPVCCRAPVAQLMSGIGEVLSPAPKLPKFWLVLVNPGVAVPTAAVFAGVEDRNPPPPPALPEGGFNGFDDLASWLATQRNDLQTAAARLCPEIDAVLAALSDARLARMSGSGATCFGLFPDETSARDAAGRVRAGTGWWTVAAPVEGGSA